MRAWPSYTDAPATACAPSGSPTAPAPLSYVLVEGAGQPDPPLGPFGHLGVACESREEIDRLCAEARREGRATRAPTDLGEPIGYVARIADPDGNSLELSFGQEVGLAVGPPAEQ